MEETKFHKILEETETGSRLLMKWDRGNGPLSSEVLLGLDESNKRILYFEEVPISIVGIGGYQAIEELIPYA
jgi:hypothetical protein